MPSSQSGTELAALRAQVRLMRQHMLMCADKLEMRGNQEPLEVAKVLRERAYAYTGSEQGHAVV